MGETTRPLPLHLASPQQLRTISTVLFHLHCLCKGSRSLANRSLTSSIGPPTGKHPLSHGMPQSGTDDAGAPGCLLCPSCIHQAFRSRYSLKHPQFMSVLRPPICRPSTKLVRTSLYIAHRTATMCKDMVCFRSACRSLISVIPHLLKQNPFLAPQWLNKSMLTCLPW